MKQGAILKEKSIHLYLIILHSKTYVTPYCSHLDGGILREITRICNNNFLGIPFIKRKYKAHDNGNKRPKFNSKRVNSCLFCVWISNFS